jgi:hypothetical protein
VSLYRRDHKPTELAHRDDVLGIERCLTAASIEAQVKQHPIEGNQLHQFIADPGLIVKALAVLIVLQIVRAHAVNSGTARNITTRHIRIIAISAVDVFRRQSSDDEAIVG